jgi:hypothetical protein
MSLIQTTMLGAMPMPINRIEIPATITNPKKGRKTNSRLISFACYVACLAITLTTTPRLWSINE